MEVVLLLVGIVGIALVVVPRMQRRSGAGSKPTKTKTKTRSRRAPAARRRSAAAAAAPPVATWTPVDEGAPAPAVGEPVSADDDVWDDDLGWEGVETARPEAREAWERWRTTESPLAADAAQPAEPEPLPEPVAELPSVERWRAQAQEEDWVEDDDGLGWEGEEVSKPTLWKGDGNGHEPEPEAWRGDVGNGQHSRARAEHHVDERRQWPRLVACGRALARAARRTGVRLGLCRDRRRAAARRRGRDRRRLRPRRRLGRAGRTSVGRARRARAGSGRPGPDPRAEQPAQAAPRAPAGDLRRSGRRTGRAGQHRPARWVRGRACRTAAGHALDARARPDAGADARGHRQRRRRSGGRGSGAGRGGEGQAGVPP